MALLELAKKYKWQLHARRELDSQLLALCSKDTLLARLLVNRNVCNANLAKYFFNVESIEESSSFEIPEMDKAISRIQEAIDKKEKIAIFGDYDVDGTSSVALLKRAFAMIDFEVAHRIPDRFADDEGYGLSLKAIKEFAASKVDLLITCDCGISNYAEVEAANKFGIDVIVTDHHSIPQNPPPSLANCNPKTLPEDHPLHWLPGVGVAYKLAQEVLRNNTEDAERKSESLLDLVALGIVADMAPLLAENRLLCIKGLKKLLHTDKPGLRALLEASGIAGRVDSDHIGFGLGPRINAAGRMKDATKAVELMVTSDYVKAQELCLNLNEENRDRQQVCADIEEEAIAMIEKDPSLLEHKVIALGSKDWHQGVIGIVASRLKEKFHLPAFVFSLLDKKAKASIRCIDVPGLDLDIAAEMDEILTANPGLFSGGGHKMAAGMSADIEDYDRLIRAIQSHFQAKLAAKELDKVLFIDAAVRLSEINWNFIDRISKLAPYGLANPKPLFACGFAKEPLVIKSTRMLGQDGKHIKLFLQQAGGQIHEAVIWQRAEEFSNDFPRAEKQNLSIVFSPEINEYQGQRRIQLVIHDWQKVSDVDENIFSRFNA